jgi:hypothetical protein
VASGIQEVGDAITDEEFASFFVLLPRFTSAAFSDLSGFRLKFFGESAVMLSVGFEFRGLGLDG